MSDQVQKAFEREGRHYEAHVEQRVGELLHPVTTRLLDHPSAARLTYQWGKGLIVNLRPAPADAPRLIGSGGKMFAAVGELLKRFGELNGLQVRYRLDNQRPSTPPKPSQPTADAGWAVYMDAVVHAHCAALFACPATTFRRVDDRLQAKSNYFLTTDPSEPDWSDDFVLALGTVWHAVGYRMGRRVYLETIRRAS